MTELLGSLNETVQIVLIYLILLAGALAFSGKIYAILRSPRWLGWSTWLLLIVAIGAVLLFAPIAGPMHAVEIAGGLAIVGAFLGGREIAHRQAQEPAGAGSRQPDPPETILERDVRGARANGVNKKARRMITRCIELTGEISAAQLEIAKSASAIRTLATQDPRVLASVADITTRTTTVVASAAKIESTLARVPVKNGEES